MKSLKLLLSALVAVVVLGTALSTTAFALVVQLPSEATARTFTGKSDGTTNPKFETEKGTSVECEASPGEGTEEANGKPLGAFHIKFEKCKGKSGVATVTCTGLGEPTGVILVLGTYHLWYDSMSPTLNVATVYLLEEVHFACPFLIPLLFKVTGTVVCLDLEPTVSNTIHLFHCNQTGGKQEDTKFFDESGVEHTASLTTTENDSTNVGSAELALGEVVSTVKTFADNV